MADVASGSCTVQGWLGNVCRQGVETVGFPQTFPRFQKFCVDRCVEPCGSCGEPPSSVSAVCLKPVSLVDKAIDIVMFKTMIDNDFKHLLEVVYHFIVTARRRVDSRNLGCRLRFPHVEAESAKGRYAYSNSPIHEGGSGSRFVMHVENRVLDNVTERERQREMSVEDGRRRPSMELVATWSLHSIMSVNAIL